MKGKGGWGKKKGDMGGGGGGIKKGTDHQSCRYSFRWVRPAQQALLDLCLNHSDGFLQTGPSLDMYTFKPCTAPSREARGRKRTEQKGRVRVSEMN